MSAWRTVRPTRRPPSIGIGALVGILLLNRLLPKVPGVLVVVVLDCPDRQPARPGGPRRGHDRRAAAGLPAVHHPDGRLARRAAAVPRRLAIAVVALADTMSTASSFAARAASGYAGNQEMIGIGAANIAAGFFQGFPVSTSGSRTAVAEQAGVTFAGHRARRGGRDHRRPGLRHRR